MARDVLVIAADGALRRSLEFLFDAEGLDAAAHADLALAVKAAGSRSRCLVIDESAFVTGEADWDTLSALAESIVVLFSGAIDIPTGHAVRGVKKPPIGVELLDAVKALLSRTDGSP